MQCGESNVDFASFELLEDSFPIIKLDFVLRLEAQACLSYAYMPKCICAHTMQCTECAHTSR